MQIQAIISAIVLFLIIWDFWYGGADAYNVLIWKVLTQ